MNPESSWQQDLFHNAVQDATAGNFSCDDFRSTDWIYFLELPPRARILILGNGLGLLSSLLAQPDRQIVIVEPNLQRTQFLKRRHTHAAEITDHLPTDTFDAVIVRDFDIPPDRSESLTLQAAKLVKPGGTLAMLRGNRMDLRTLLSRGKNKKDHSTLKGYRRHLTKAGFEHVREWAPLPFYDKPAMFYLPLSNRTAFQFFIKSVFPLLDSISPEVKSRYAMMHRLAKIGLKTAAFPGVRSLMIRLFSGYLFIATKKSDATPTH